MRKEGGGVRTEFDPLNEFADGSVALVSRRLKRERKKEERNKGKEHRIRGKEKMKDRKEKKEGERVNTNPVVAGARDFPESGQHDSVAVLGRSVTVREGEGLGGRLRRNRGRGR
jgi:hypothetical protein